MDTVATGKIAQLFKEDNERELQLPKVKKKKYTFTLNQKNIAEIEKLDAPKSTIIDIALQQYLFGCDTKGDQLSQQILKLENNNEYLHGQLQAASEREKKLVEIIDKLATVSGNFSEKKESAIQCSIFGRVKKLVSRSKECRSKIASFQSLNDGDIIKWLKNKDIRVWKRALFLLYREGEMSNIGIADKLGVDQRGVRRTLSKLQISSNPQVIFKNHKWVITPRGIEGVEHNQKNGKLPMMQSSMKNESSVKQIDQMCSKMEKKRTPRPVQNKIYKYMKDHPKATTIDVRKAVGCKYSTAKKFCSQYRKELISPS